MKPSSLQAKLTLPLAVGVAICAALILMVVMELAHRNYRSELAVRAEQIAKSAQEALEITPEAARRSQLISEYGASGAVRFMAIAAGAPARVSTATQRKLIDQELAAVSPVAARLAELAAATGRAQSAWLPDGSDLLRAVPLRLSGNMPSLKGVQEAVLLVQVDGSTLRQSVASNGAAVFGVMFLVFGMLVALLYGVVRSQVIRPVGQLRDFVEARLKGDSGARFACAGDDELAQLGASFERLLHDIDTERHRSRDAVAELEAVNRRLAGVIDAAPDAIVACREDGVVKLINPAGEKLLGYRLHDLGEVTLEELVPGVAGTRPAAGEYFQAQARTRAGDPVPVEMTLSRAGAARGTAVLAILRDISQRLETEQELRVSQERLALAARGGQLGTWDWNTETDVCHVNDIWLEINGLARIRPDSESVLAAWMERMDSASLERSAEAMRQIDLGDCDVMELTVRLRISEDEWRWIHNRGEVIERSATGKALRMAGTSRDITAMVAARGELELARDEALRAFRVRSEFLANVSHELRTPLNGILGMLNLLESSSLSAEQRELVQVAERSGRGLSTLINNVLDFSKLEAGEVQPENIAFPVRELAEDVVRMNAEAAQRKDVEITLIVQAAVAPVLRGDPARIGQVLTNLVSNAVKFTEQGEVRVEIRPAQTARCGLSISVRDTGIGIPADLQREIFEAFSQADGSTTRKYGGTGLGLAICRQLTEAMDGTITVVSAPGKGSEFHVQLPLGRAGEEEPGEASALPDLSSTRVLVLEGSVSRHSAISEVLVPAGADVVAAAGDTDPRSALASLPMDGEGFDVVVAAGGRDAAATQALVAALRRFPATAAARIVLTVPFSATLGASTLQPDVSAIVTRPLRRRALLEAVAGAPGRSPADVAADGGEAAAGTAAAGARLLVVDDVPVNLKVALGMLRQHGFDADTAEDGAAAVAAVTGGGYDLVLMDCQMPGMDGFDATRAIRAAPASVKQPVIVAMTASAMLGDYQKCLRAGMDDYLSKPLDQALLVRTVRNWLAGRGSPAAAGAGPTVAGNSGSAAITSPDDGGQKLKELTLLLGDDSVAELVDVFLEDGAERIEDMRDALARGDSGAVQSAAHAVKGSAANLGFTELAEWCRRLEAATDETMAGLLEAAAAAFERLAERLREGAAIELGAE